jgi:hypothetical protein
VTRSIAGRRRNGRLVAVSAGVVTIFATAALAGCSAGQISETASIVSAVPGGATSVSVPTQDNPNGALLIKNVTVDYNDINGYAVGATAPLSMWMINQSTETITVTAGDAQLVDPTKASKLTLLGSMNLSSGTQDIQAVPGVAGSVPSSSVGPAAAPSEAPSTANEPSGATSVGPSESVAPSTTAAPTAPAAASVTIQPGTMVVLSTSAGAGVQHLEVPGLRQALVPGNTVQLTFNVTKDGTPLQSTQVVAPVAPPTAPAPRLMDSGFPPSPSAT